MKVLKSVRIDKDLLELAAQVAATEDRSINAVINRAIRAGLTSRTSDSGVTYQVAR